MDYFTQVVIQRDPALMGQASLRERVLSQTNTFAEHYGNTLPTKPTPSTINHTHTLNYPTP